MRNAWTKLGTKLNRHLYTEVMVRDLYRASMYLLLGGKIVGIGRFYPVIKLNIRVPRLTIWYTEHIGIVRYKKLKHKREYIKELAKQRRPTKKEQEVMRLYKNNFARIQAEGRNA